MVTLRGTLETPPRILNFLLLLERRTLAKEEQNEAHHHRVNHRTIKRELHTSSTIKQDERLFYNKNTRDGTVYRFH